MPPAEVTAVASAPLDFLESPTRASSTAPPIRSARTIYTRRKNEPPIALYVLGILAAVAGLGAIIYFANQPAKQVPNQPVKRTEPVAKSSGNVPTKPVATGEQKTVAEKLVPAKEQSTGPLLPLDRPSIPVDNDVAAFVKEATSAARLVALWPRPKTFLEKVEKVEDLLTRIPRDSPYLNACKQIRGELNGALASIAMREKALLELRDSPERQKLIADCSEDAKDAAKNAEALLDQIK